MGVKVPREADIQRAVIAFLELRGCVVVRCNSGAVTVGDRFVRFNSAPGCSDLLVCLPGGGFAAVEVKAPGGKLTPAQAAFLDRVRAAGGVGAVVRGIPDAEAVLADIEGRADR
jgi:hypothetical protein